MPENTFTRWLYLLIFCGVFCRLPLLAAPPDEVMSPAAIKNIMQSVCDYTLAHPAMDADQPDNGWIRSTFYIGVMATYRSTGVARYLDEAIRWSEKSRWKPGMPPLPDRSAILPKTDRCRPGQPSRLADYLCCAQVYLGIYSIKKDPRMIAGTRKAVDDAVEAHISGRDNWWWCDALFMEPPVLAELSAAVRNRRYLIIMDRMWWNTARCLFDRREDLYYRDESFVKQRTAGGKKVFWSRGNGWVMAGICRVLEYLPENDSRRERYGKLLRKMAKKIIAVQGSDGLWRSSLLDPDEFPAPETSGSALFCYALAWGINHGYLSRQTCLPAVRKAWTGLVRCVSPEGRLGYVQPVASQPAPAFPDQTHEYGAGAFLLAGSEVAKL